MEITITICDASEKVKQGIFRAMLEGCDRVKPIPAAPAPEKKAKPALEKKTARKVPEGGWKIPFSSVTDKKKYENAWKLCRKTGKPYPEAIKDLKKDPPGPVREGPAAIVGTPSPQNTRHKPAAPVETIPPSPVKGDVPAAAAGPYAVGSKVREIGKNKTHAGIGTIKRSPQMGTQCMVAFEHGTAWLSKDHLEPVLQTAPMVS